MKKIYLVLIGVSISMLTMAQAHFEWGAFINDGDFATTGVYADRQAVNVFIDETGIVEDAATLNEIWTAFDTMPGYITTQEAYVGSVPAEDQQFQGNEVVFITDDTWLMCLLKVKGVAKNSIDVLDVIEFVYNPNTNGYYDDTVTTAVPVCADVWASMAGWAQGNFHCNDEGKWVIPTAPTDSMVLNDGDMKRMFGLGQFDSEGAGKTETSPFNYPIDSLAGTTGLPGRTGDVDMTSGSAVFNHISMVNNVNGAVSGMEVVNTTDYYYLIKVPLTQFGDDYKFGADSTIALAAQVRKGTFDQNDSQPWLNTSESYWLGTDKNAAWMMLAYYGAVGTGKAYVYDPGTSINSSVAGKINVYYANDMVVAPVGSNVVVYNIAGSVVSTKANVSNLAKGVYVAKVQSAKGNATIKFIK